MKAQDIIDVQAIARAATDDYIEISLEMIRVLQAEVATLRRELADCLLREDAAIRELDRLRAEMGR